MNKHRFRGVPLRLAGPPQGRARRTAGLIGIFCILSLAAACSSSAGDTGPSNGQSVKIIYVRDVPQPAPFDAPIVKGYKEAGRQLGDNTVFQGAPANTKASDPAQEQRLIQNAVAEKPDCLIVTFDTPSAEGPAVSKAIAAGIPVVFANAGFDQADKYGALTYVGADETLQGKTGAEQLTKLGVRHPLVVTLATGSLPLTDERNAGFKGAFTGDASWLYLSLTQAVGSTSSVAGAIEAKLASDPTIDGVFSMGVVFAPAELAAHDAVGSRAGQLKWATIDTSDQILDAVKAGKLSFALDQQQYLQGYWSALVCDQYVRYGLKPADSVMATGPLVVTKQNLPEYEKAASEGIH